MPNLPNPDPSSRRGNGGRPHGRGNNPGSAGTHFTQDRRDKYCEELRLHGEKPLAREAVGVSSSTVNRHRMNDDEFREAEDRAMELYRASVHKEIHRRAIDGVEEPIYHNGARVGWKTRYSDQLLLAHAKRHSPELYGDKIRVDQTTHVDGALGLALEKLSPESRGLLRKIIEIEGGDGEQATTEAGG